jgi:hypothetical protein
MGKAQQFADDAKAAGWEVTHKAVGDRETVAAHKGEIQMALVWDANRYNYPDSQLLVSGQPKTVRNASEARKILAGVEVPRASTPRKPTAKSATRKPKRVARPAPDDTDDEPQRRNPTWGERYRALPNDEIRRKVLGKTIVWRNTLSGLVQEAAVMKDPNQKQLRVEFNKSQRRIITFASIGGGFVSVYVDAIIELR